MEFKPRQEKSNGLSPFYLPVDKSFEWEFDVFLTVGGFLTYSIVFIFVVLPDVQYGAIVGLQLIHGSIDLFTINLTQVKLRTEWTRI